MKKFYVAVVALALVLSGCGQLNREYTIRITAEENSAVELTLNLSGFEVSAEDANKLDNKPDVSPEVDLNVVPLIP